MKKEFFAALIIFAILLAFLFVGTEIFHKFRPITPSSNIQPSSSSDVVKPTTPASNQDQGNAVAPDNQPDTGKGQTDSGFQSPLDRTGERVTKKPFGIFITPKTSPVQPERFQGYHTGTDFEIFPEELSTDVPVHAICSGKIAVKRFASGYGGVLVQDCSLNSQPITVIYGHLKLTSISKNAGDNLDTGDIIGSLGKAFSSETDGERKHLHLGIHKGSAVNILGYVQSKSELSGWVDACSLVCK